MGKVVPFYRPAFLSSAFALLISEELRTQLPTVEEMETGLFAIVGHDQTDEPGFGVGITAGGITWQKPA